MNLFSLMFTRIYPFTPHEIQHGTSCLKVPAWKRRRATLLKMLETTRNGTGRVRTTMHNQTK